MKRLFLSVAAVALVAAAPAPASPPTAKEAKTFVAKAEKNLAEISVYASKAEWVAETSSPRVS